MSVRANWSQFRVKLQWLLDSADLIDRPDHSRRLSVRLLTVNSEFMNLENSYQRILELVDEGVPAEREIVLGARADYARALEAFDRLMSIKLEEAPANSSSSTVNARSEVADLDALLSRLPALRLPSFAGEMDQWVGFNNLFDSLVDKRSDLSPAQKLAYLMSCLSGEPRGLVQHLKIADEGYSIARDLLMKRYQNTRRLGDVHVDQILKLPTISGRLSGLRSQFLNPLIMAVNQLERLGFPVSEWSFILLHICLSKLPASLKSRFEQKFGCESDTIPKYSDLVEFLETECRLIECANLESTNQYDCNNSRQAKPARRSVHYAAAEVKQPCICCGDSKHLSLTVCPEFKSMSPFARKDFVDKERLCFHCLGNHSYRDCRRELHCSCGSTKHHPMLCFNRSGVQQRHNSNNNRSSAERSTPRTGGGFRQQSNVGRVKSPRDLLPAQRTSSPSRRREEQRDDSRNGNRSDRPRYGRSDERNESGRRDDDRALLYSPTRR
ncbi:uncharacterized protein LOC123879803 [Maniola jurtina]|uniref:uncharacterized protein LOC123879803 n=1 Tax=Maniola jurtina TaxID=191418 RepID=UPI001E68DBAE|nr:uncharacterized protein LOC123879803 [Maniola jurtina]